MDVTGRVRTDQRGVTLVELLITTIIGAIAFLALAVPFVAERNFFISGNAQAESQRDAQVVFRAIARQMRQGGDYQITGVAPSHILTVYDKPGGVVIGCFQGGPAFGNRFQTDTAACTAGSPALIDGGQSQVTNFTVSSIIPSKLVHLQINVLHKNRENELLETNVYLRNAS